MLGNEKFYKEHFFHKETARHLHSRFSQSGFPTFRCASDASLSKSDSVYWMHPCITYTISLLAKRAAWTKRFLIRPTNTFSFTSLNATLYHSNF